MESPTISSGEYPPTKTAASGLFAMITLAMLTNPSGVLGAITPTLINSYVARGSISISTAVLLGAAEMAGMTVALFCGPLYVNRFNRRTLAGIAVTVAAAGQLLSLFTDQSVALGALRIAAGAGEGGLFAVAIASLAATASPERAFGIVVSSNLTWGTVLLAAIVWFSGRYPAQGAIIVFFVFTMLTALFIPSLPRRGTVLVAEAGPNSDRRGRYAPAFCGLSGIFLFSAAFGTVWPIAGQIAIARHVPAAVIHHAYSLAGFGGICGALIAAASGARFGRLLSLVVGTLGFAFWLALPTYNVSFVATALLILFFWAFTLPYFFAMLAELDPTGRLAVLTGGMIPFGITVGQVFSGPIVAAEGFHSVTFIGGALSLGALLFVLIATYLAKAGADGRMARA